MLYDKVSATGSHLLESVCTTVFLSVVSGVAVPGWARKAAGGYAMRLLCLGIVLERCYRTIVWNVRELTVTTADAFTPVADEMRLNRLDFRRVHVGRR